MESTNTNMEPKHYAELIKLYKLALSDELQEQELKQVLKEAVLEKDRNHIAGNDNSEVDEYINELNTLHDAYLTRRTSHN